MKNVVRFVIAAVAIFSAVSSGAMVKCNVDGKIVYQDAPCLDGAGAAIKPPNSPAAAPSPAGQGAASANPSGKVPSAQKPAALDADTKKASDEAFQRHMADGDYRRALAFATDEKQKNKARAALRKKEDKCADLRIRRDEADANSKLRGGRLQHAADAAQARYRSLCGR